MRARIDIRLSREQVAYMSKLLDERPSADFVTADCTVNLSEIRFDDSYTTLVSGTELCSTTAVMRCK